MLKSLGNAKLKLLLEHLGLDWKWPQDWASSSCQHSSHTPPHQVFISPHVLFLYSCFRFPSLLTFASNRIKTYIEKWLSYTGRNGVLNLQLHESVCSILYNIFCRLSELLQIVTARFSIICIYNDYAWWWVPEDPV